MQFFNAIQSNLDEASAIPVLGPLVASPCKIVVGVAQMVAGIAGAIIFGILATLAGKVEQKSWVWRSTLGFFSWSIQGLANSLYGVVNILTVGVTAYQFDENKKVLPFNDEPIYFF